MKNNSRIARSRMVLPILSILTLVFLTTACATNRAADKQVSDGAITTKIIAKFTADPEINPFNIDVDTIDGVVRLSGMVDDRATRAEAEKLARGTHGVIRVENDVKVGEKTAGETLDDAGITTRVKAKITGNEDLNPFNIDVDTQDGVVTLSGKVADASRIKLAKEIAASVSGVKRVDNRLTVDAD